jgi:NAD(P)-dependent dehydrogenase (short-subunit alcohol dehydrogenase family)
VSVVFLSIGGGRQIRLPNRGQYSATKWGLIGFSKTLSIELGQYEIRVNAILPGAVDDPRLQKVIEGRAKLSGQTLEEVQEASMANQSLKALVDPGDIAALAVFLASDSAKSISGQMLPLDGDIKRLLENQRIYGLLVI